MASSLHRALRHGSLYSAFQAAGTAVSLISFPILTRLFSVEEYGYLALFNATVSMLLAIAKCGITTSMIRLHANMSLRSHDAQRELYSSAVAASLALTLAIVGVFAIAVAALSDYLGRTLVQLLLMGSALVVIQDQRDVFLTFFRAEERVLAQSAVTLVIRAGTVATGCAVALTAIQGLHGYLTGAIAFEALTVTLVAFSFARRGLVRGSAISPSTMRLLVAYGAPLLLFEFSSLLNDYADRFMINHFLGPASVGQYSVGYNLALYVQALITAPLWMAIFPIYTKIWEVEGAGATTSFLSRVLEFYVRGAVLVAAVVTLVGRELITILATAKFAPAADITPFVIGSVLIYGTTHITAAGFYLTKKTHVIALLMVGAAALNIALNLVFIPSLGVIGAAYATMASYLVLTALVSYRANRLLAVRFPFRVITIAVVAGFAAYFTANSIDMGTPALGLLAKSAAGMFVYGLIMALLDRPFTQWVVVRLSALARRPGRH